MKFETDVARMQGPFSAIFTPYDEAGAVNFEMLSAIAEFQLAHGVRGFFATGSTGEGLLLTTDERNAVVRFLAENFRERATIIAHVGHPSTEIAVGLAREAADAGAHWISSVAPIYHGTTFAGAMRHYQAISNRVELPFMIYSLGAVVDSRRDAAFFELPNVCGMKYTGANFFSVQQLQRNVKRPIALMSGFDEQFVAGQSFGFVGGIGTTFNFAPGIYAGIYEHYHRGEIGEAVRLQSEINRVTDLMASYENWSYRKAVMRYIGFDCGPARAPYAPLSEHEYREFAKLLDAIGVLPPSEVI